ncbi:hypothetical protein GH714_036528 [Hevea brasiliensis]|uniref:MULE transposase domain-containing protein n=1 Tax=Hevea brasiliensis TaxID=3981 RepID=A0A6A6M7F1_HEVBR|nr:hypothetical protein GH714_036528 [Hevea brasiliensis]
MFPISWCVVEGENENSWKWFLDRLFKDQNLFDGLGLTVVSDQQKGLAKAIKELVPHMEHRNYARHIYANWKKLHKGQEFKSLFWKTVYATYEAAFKKHITALKDLDVKANEDFMKQDKRVFYKAFINTWPKCDVVTSNLAEAFNSYICKARTMPSISMFEESRSCLMERMYNKYESGKKRRPRKYLTFSSKTRKKKVKNQGAEPIETSIQQIETTLNQHDTRKQNVADLRMARKGFGLFVFETNGSINAREKLLSILYMANHQLQHIVYFK